MASCHVIICNAQPAREPVLLGTLHSDSLLNEPYLAWFQKNYSAYTTQPEIRSRFSKADLKNLHIEAFFGSWCGDSKRELPRMMKVLDEIGFDKSKVSLIGLGSSDTLYKQSPGREEAGKSIFRVPVFIVYKNGKEIGRINEFPVESLERDLLSIVKQENYIANYKTFVLLHQWLNAGLLLDSNVSVRGLANKIKPFADNDYEINSVAKLLARQGYKTESLKLFMINANLFPSSSIAVSSLAEAYLEHENKKAAITVLEKFLDTKPAESTKPLIDLLLKAKQG